ncbi:hypothetical protein BJX76DRAFT_228561 [Aspergillus varians]
MRVHYSCLKLRPNSSWRWPVGTSSWRFMLAAVQSKLSNLHVSDSQTLFDSLRRSNPDPLPPQTRNTLRSYSCRIREGLPCRSSRSSQTNLPASFDQRVELPFDLCLHRQATSPQAQSPERKHSTAPHATASLGGNYPYSPRPVASAGQESDYRTNRSQHQQRARLPRTIIVDAKCLVGSW